MTAEADPPRDDALPLGTKDFLLHSPFARLWRAMLVSSLGDWAGITAVVSIVAGFGSTAGAAAAAVALVMSTRLVTAIILGPFTGVLVDRFDRRNLMVAADLGRAGLYLVIALVPHLAVIAVCSACIEALSLVWSPARDASLPGMVGSRELPRANSATLFATYGTLPLGAALFAALAAAASAVGAAHVEAPALIADAATFLFSAWTIRSLHLPMPTARVPRRGPMADARDGLAYVWHERTIRVLVRALLLGFAAAGAVISLTPVLSQRVLDANPAAFGVLVTSLGIGILVGLVAGPRVLESGRETRSFNVALGLGSVCLGMLAVSPSLLLAAAVSLPTGVSVAVSWVAGTTLLQRRVPDDFRGRTFAIVTVSARVSLLTGRALFPFLASVLVGGTRLGLVLAAAMLAVAAISTHVAAQRG